jgi:hypothetical protein
VKITIAWDGDQAFVQKDTPLARKWRGRGLWVIDPAANALVALDRVTLLGKSAVYGLAPNTKNGDVVIVAFGSRGVAFVSVKPRK